MGYVRLTTENPQSNVDRMLNMVKAINNEVFLRNVYEEDISLIDYCKAEYKRLYNEDIDASVEEFGEYMDDDSLLSMFYWMTVGYAELRLRLSQYEDMGLSPKELKAQQSELEKYREIGTIKEMLSVYDDMV